MKMEPIVSSGTSAIRTQTPGNYPKRNKLHLGHGESLKTRVLRNLFLFGSMKMEPIVSSETSAIRTQTPGNYPKRNKLHLEHGESLKTRVLRIIHKNFKLPRAAIQQCVCVSLQVFTIRHFQWGLVQMKWTLVPALQFIACFRFCRIPPLHYGCIWLNPGFC